MVLYGKGSMFSVVDFIIYQISMKRYITSLITIIPVLVLT